MAAAAGEKAVEIGGKMAEKQMEKMEQQQNKVDQFLGSEVSTFLTSLRFFSLRLRNKKLKVDSPNGFNTLSSNEDC